MFGYLEGIIVECPDDLKKATSIFPANNNLFKFNEDSPRLDNKKSDLFHQITARLLFAAKRARSGIQVCVAFLCTRVKDPHEDDYKKLRQVIKYVQETIHLPLVIGADGSGNLVWNIDAAFAVHRDCKSHTRAVLIMGHGAVLSISSKQKISTKSSTEAELVRVDDAMTFVMWMKHFFQSQVKDLNNLKLNQYGKLIIIKQDNTSAIQLERNGWKSSTKCTKHIDIQYFYITDRLKDGNVSEVV